MIDHKGGYSFFNPNGSTFLRESDSRVIRLRHAFFYAFVRIITYNLRYLKPVDAVFEDENNILYVLRDGQYECYAYQPGQANALKKLEGFPKPIKGNLSFNMDKFFNKLHVTESVNADPSGDKTKDINYLNLSYITPQDSILVSGKVRPDFTFEEGDIRIDQDKHNILYFNKALIGSLNQTYDNTLNEEIRSIFTTTTTTVNSLITKANRLNKFNNALGVIKAQVNLDKLDKTKFNKALSDLTPAPTGISASGVKTKSAAFLNAYEARSNKKNKEILAEAIASLNAEIQKTKAKVTNAFTNLKVQIKEIKEGLDSSQEDRYENISINVSTHQENASLYRDIIRFINQFPDLANKRKAKILTLKNTLDDYETSLLTDLIEIDKTVAKLSETTGKASKLSSFISNLKKVKTALASASSTLSNWKSKAELIDVQSADLAIGLDQDINQIREIHFGRFDIFPKEFNIANNSNFTFGEPDWFFFETKSGSFLCRPLPATPVSGNTTSSVTEATTSTINKEFPDYEIIRLTTTVIPKISNQLFSGGIKTLLSTRTQSIDELPRFESRLGTIDPITENIENIILYSPEKIKRIPESHHLDYHGANTNYYWEIFFHAPFLIAQALNKEQKFEEAKQWYEYIFDPTAVDNTWKFLPFTKALQNGNMQEEIDTYLNDPFDPHAIARLRQVAYRKAIVMRYIDNLVDWGDMLFRQYSRESINEARILYLLAYDLLGTKPENLGHLTLDNDASFEQLNNNLSFDFLFELENEMILDSTPAEISATAANDIVMESLLAPMGTIHDSILNPYFFIPQNSLFTDYWDRVEDRLYKIRHSLNILGNKQALPLFQPPIDPLAIVRAVGSGLSLSQAVANSVASIPHYRFSFVVNRAKELIQKLSQFGGELLNAIERKDAEELNLLQNKQEGILLTIIRKVREAQIKETETTITSLDESIENTKATIAHYDHLIKTGLSPWEKTQVKLTGAGAALQLSSGVGKLVSAGAHLAPNTTFGAFITGAGFGGSHAGAALDKISEASETLGEGLSMIGEAIAIKAQNERMKEDWRFAKTTAESDLIQIQAQLAGTKLQKQVAEYELLNLEKEVEHNKEIKTFYKDKFNNKQLHQWMVGQLSGLYFQSYKMAFDMAKYAEKAFQYERGVKESETGFIDGMYWDSQKKGLLAGERLGVDLDRMEQAFLETDQRRFEISKNVSLLALDPIALLQLKSTGACTFSLNEALFDYDFQGHYCRQVKTISLSFDIGEGQTVMATLTQLSHKTLLEPDAKGAKYLLDPKNDMPLSIRSNWKANQQVALSHVDEYEKNNGLFELRFDDTRYLPFEGTGAVSNWKLELNGKKGSYNTKDILDVIVNIKYTALQGGEVFADAIKGMLKPYPTAQYFDVAYEFADEWNAFKESDSQDLTLFLSQDYFPNMSSSKISGIFTSFELEEPEKASMVLNQDTALTLKDKQYLNTSGLSVSSNGSDWIFTFKGDKENLTNMELVLTYKASVQ